MENICFFISIKPKTKLNKTTMAETKKITQKYWNSLSEGFRYRALRKVFSNFPDSVNEDYAKERAKDLGWMWKVIQSHVKMPAGKSFYKTVIDRTWIP